MRNFIVKIVFFILIFISGAYALDYYITKGLKMMVGSIFYPWVNIEKSEINANVIFMGNSRALCHFSPKLIDSMLNVNSYNLGTGGNPFNIQYLKYLFYIEHNIKPKVIVQNVDFLTFDFSGFNYNRDQILPFVTDPVLKEHLPSVGFSKIEIYAPLYRYYGYPTWIKSGVLEFVGLKHYVNDSYYKGFLVDDGQWNPTNLNKMEKLYCTPNPKTIELFDNRVKYCRANNICLILVYSPVYYRTWSKIEGRAKFDSLFHSFSDKYKLPYFDYSRDSICFDSTSFHIGIHLNSKGVRWLSSKLSRNLKPYVK